MMKRRRIKTPESEEIEFDDVTKEVEESAEVSLVRRPSLSIDIPDEEAISVMDRPDSIRLSRKAEYAAEQEQKARAASATSALTPDDMRLIESMKWYIAEERRRADLQTSARLVDRRFAVAYDSMTASAVHAALSPLSDAHSDTGYVGDTEAESAAEPVRPKTAGGKRP